MVNTKVNLETVMSYPPKTIFSDKLYPQGLVEIFVTRGKPTLHTWGALPSKPGFPQVYTDHRIEFSDCELIAKHVRKNIIVNQGKDAVIRSLTTGNLLVIARMCVGDRGTLPSDSTVPKVPTPTMTTLYNEVNRSDVEAVILNVGSPSIHEVKFVKTFNAAGTNKIPITAFSNQSKPVLNEVGIVMFDPAMPPPLPRPDNYGPYTPSNQPPSDEVLFAIRTFKSVPFEESNDMSVTIRYTIFIE